MKLHKWKKYLAAVMSLMMVACGADRQGTEPLSGVLTEIATPAATTAAGIPEEPPTEIVQETPSATPTPTEIVQEMPSATPTPTEIVQETPSATPTPTKAPEPNPDGSGEQTGEITQPKIVAFTFDDGPYTPVTSRITGVLAEYGASATFFVAGERLSTYKETLIATSDAGFEIGNHTWAHKDLNTLSEKKVREEVQKTFDKIHEYISGESVLVRPPYGNANRTVRDAIDAPLVNWSLDSEDWKSRDADTIIEHVLKNIKDGDIVLMHDLYPSTAEAVEYLVPELTARGYQIVSVSELYERKGKTLKNHCIHRTTRE